MPMNPLPIAPKDMPSPFRERWEGAGTDTERSLVLTDLAREYHMHGMTVSSQLGEVALDLALRDGSPEAAVMALMNLSWTHVNMNKHLRAIEFCAQAIQLIQEHRLDHLEAHALNNRALTLMELGDEAGAQRDLHRALQLAQAQQDQTNVLRSCTNLAWIFNQSQRPQRALHFLNLFQEELTRLQEPELRFLYQGFLHENRAQSLALLAEEAGAQGRSEAFAEFIAAGLESVRLTHEALKVSMNGNVAMLIEIHHAHLCRLSGDLDAAQASLDAAQNYVEHDDVGVYPDFFLCSAALHETRAQWAQGLADYESALNLVRGKGKHQVMQAILLKMADLHERSGDLAGALVHTRAALTESQRALSRLCSEDDYQERLALTPAASLQSWQERLRSAEFLARQDALTSLLNRRGLDDTLQRLQETEEPDTPVLVAFIDIDHFKTVNDQFSHAVGDKTLQQTAKLLKRSLPAGGFLCRYGGEEFVFVLTNPAQEPSELLEGCRRYIENYDWQKLLPGRTLTVSIGYTSGSLAQVESLLHTADEYLYQAKRAGRNRIHPAVQTGKELTEPNL